MLRGHLAVLPVNGTLLYVEPLFLEAENAAIPQLERVIIARPGRVVMEPTFESAVATLLGAPSAPAPAESSEGVGVETAGEPGWEPLTQARRLLDEAERLLRAGDWAGFGRALQALRDALTPPPTSP